MSVARSSRPHPRTVLAAQAADQDRAARIHARRWRTLAVLSLSLVIVGLDNTILNVALPTIQDHFGASGATLQWIVDSYLLVFAGLLLTMGTLGDRFGRKKALVAGLAVFGGASLAVLVTDTSGQLIAVRAAMGVGGALIMPATLSIISNVFPREERAKAIAIWSAMAAIGVGLGPFIGGLLLNWFSWQSVFLVNVPVAALAIALAIRLVPDSRDPRPGRFDFVGAAVSALGVLAVVYAIIEAPTHGWLGSQTLGAAAVGAALLAGFVWWELHVAEPMLNLSFFSNPRFSIGVLAIAIAFFSLFGSIFAVTQFLQFAHGYSALQAGAAMIPLALGLMVGAGSSAKLAARVGAARVVSAGLTGLGLSLLSTTLWTPAMPYWPLGVWFFVAAFSMGWIMGPATDAVMGAVPIEKAGIASAMNDVARQVAGALGVAVVGSLVASSYGRRLDTDGLSGQAQELAQDSIGGARVVSQSLPAARADTLLGSASDAFTGALGVGLAAAGSVALVAAVLVALRLPARHAAEAPVQPEVEAATAR